jgi:hypothetical protein
MAVLGASAAIVLHRLGPGAVLSIAAHESEARSLLRIALFPGHALRELPHVVALGCVFAGTVFPAGGRGTAKRQLGVVLAWTLAWAVGLFLWASLESDWRLAWEDLSQQRGWPGALAPGLHVRLHLASDLGLGLLLLAAAGLFEGARPGVLAIVGAVLLAGMAIAAGFADVTHPRLVGHAAREMFTHALLTVPLLMAWTARSVPLRSRPWRAPWWAWAALGAATAVTAGLGRAVLRAGEILRYSSAPRRTLELNLAAHSFEHVLDLIQLVVLVSLVSRATDGRARRS